MDKYLSYWEEHLDVDQFNKWHDGVPHMRDTASLYDLISTLNAKNLLDCGAGTGHFYGVMNDLRKKRNVKTPEIEYQGLEITPKYIQYAKEYNIPISYGDIENIPYPDQSYDMVMAQNVLNHLHDYRPAIKEMVRVSKKYIVFTMFKDSLENLLHGPMSKEAQERCIGWYPGKWDPGNLPISCPYLGFYPKGTYHSPWIILNKNHKLIESELGLYYVAEKDDNGEPVCIHHHYYFQKLFDYISHLIEEEGYDYQFRFSMNGDMSTYYQKNAIEGLTPHPRYYSHMFSFEKIEKEQDMFTTISEEK